MLVIALFVIIVLAFLGAAMVQINSDSSRSVIYEVYGARALHTANSGAERMLNGTFGPNITTNACESAPINYALPDTAAFSGCELTVICAKIDITEADYSFTHFRIKSTATCSAGDMITKRSVEVEARERKP